MNELLDFRSAARKHFAFLKVWGFSEPEERLEAHACWLTYTSPKVSLLLCYGPPEFEASLSFWLRSAPELSLGAGDLIAAGQRPELWAAAPGTENIEAHVSFLASAIHSVEEQLCSGDTIFFGLLTSARRAAIDEWIQSEKLKTMRSKAEAAWKNKRFNEIVALYNSVSGSLTGLEKKRLSYAEKHAKQVVK